MAVVNDPEAPKPKRKSKSKSGSSFLRGSKPKKRTPKPPNRVDPGWVHHVLAAGLLRVGKQVFIDRRQVDIEVGDTSYEPSITDTEDGPEPADLLARIIAAVFYRLPGIRRLEKRLEGTDKTSGILSDLAALAVQLGRRNRPLVAEAITRLVQEVMKRKEHSESPVNSHDPSHGSGRGTGGAKDGMESSRPNHLAEIFRQPTTKE